MTSRLRHVGFEAMYSNPIAVSLVLAFVICNACHVNSITPRRNKIDATSVDRYMPVSQLRHPQCRGYISASCEVQVGSLKDVYILSKYASVMRHATYLTVHSKHGILNVGGAYAPTDWPCAMVPNAPDLLHGLQASGRKAHTEADTSKVARHLGILKSSPTLEVCPSAQRCDAHSA